MKYFLSLLFALFISIASAAQTAKPYPIQISSDRILSLQTVMPKESGHPHLLFLPGINRGLLANEGALQKFAEAGYGFTTMNFSTQPFSVVKLQNSTSPAFSKKFFQLKDFADEVEAVIAYLKKSGIKEDIIPVSLSFSGSVSSILKNKPVIFETVPMTSSAAVNPDLEKYRQTLLAGEFWNPIFGPGITRVTLDSAYRKEWKDRAQNQIDQFHLPANQLDQFVEGYVSMARTTEGFTWDLDQLPQETRRVFLIAENESPLLLKDQAQTILKLIDKGFPISFYFVKNSGHVIPSDQPEMYVQIFQDSLSNKNPRFAIADSNHRNIDLMDLEQAKKFLQNLSH